MTVRAGTLLVPPSQFSASSLGFEVQSILSKGRRRGTIHSVFRKAVNVFFSKEEFVSLVDLTVGNGPSNMVVALSQGQTFDSFQLNPGDAVFANASYFRAGSRLCINIVSTVPYFSKHDFSEQLRPLPQIRSNMEKMKAVLANFGKFEGLRSLFQTGESKVALPLVEGAITENIKSLVAAIQLNDLETVRKCSTQLLGLGPGLTPTADDLLSGFMLAYYLFTENLEGDLRRAARINQAIMEPSDQTTTLSRNYLKQAAAGNAAEFAQDVIESLLTEKGEAGRVERTTIRLLDMGSTSGSDAAVGIVLGANLALKLKDASKRHLEQ